MGFMVLILPSFMKIRCCPYSVAAQRENGNCGRAKPLFVNGSVGNIKNRKDYQMEKRLIFDYIGQHSEYGKHKSVCHMCGTNDDDVVGKLIFEGNPDGVWAGEHFEFPVCTCCFYECLGEAMRKMDSAMLQREIEREKMMMEYWENLEPLC